MHRTIYAISIILIALTACDRSDDHKRQIIEQRITKIAKLDWSEGIPLDELIEASKACNKFPDITQCTVLDSQLMDVAISLASCDADHRSGLCSAVVKAIGAHPIIQRLPDAAPIVLPQNPFYFSLPTEVLNSQAWKFSYRSESWLWFWAVWQWVIIGTVLFSLSLYALWRKREKEAKDKQARDAEEKQQIKIRQDLHAAELKRLAQIQAEKEARERIRRNEELEEKLKKESEDRIVRAANERAEKLAKEKAEIAEIMSTALSGISTPKSERRAKKTKGI